MEDSFIDNIGATLSSWMVSEQFIYTAFLVESLMKSQDIIINSSVWR